MFQKISGNIISGRSRDILWRSLEIYREKTWVPHSKIIRKAMKNSEESKSLEADIAISQLPKNQSFWPCHCPHGWWTTRASSSSSSQDPGELRQSETPAFAPGTGHYPGRSCFFLGGRFGVFMCHFPIDSPWFRPKSCGFSHWFWGFQSGFTQGCRPRWCRPRWCRQNMGTWFSQRVEMFLCLSYSSKKLLNMPIISLCIAFVMCTAKPSSWEYLGKSSGKYENLRSFSRRKIPNIGENPWISWEKSSSSSSSSSSFSSTIHILSSNLTKLLKISHW